MSMEWPKFETLEEFKYSRSELTRESNDWIEKQKINMGDNKD